MINVPHSILLILIAAAVTFAIRAFPFLVFGGKKTMPDAIRRIADMLPPAIIAVLVIYCVKGDILNLGTGFLASFIAIVSLTLIHLWKRNTLLSIAVGTVIYMVLIRLL